jgi:SAM-dependent methyltransferase
MMRDDQGLIDAIEQLSSEPLQLLIKAIRLKVTRRARRSVGVPGRFIFHSDTLAGKGPESIIRTYVDHNGLRKFLSEVPGGLKLQRVSELGCGYGRMSLVLTEFADETWGFERETHLVQMAQRLVPEVRFRNVGSLASLPEGDGSFDLAMTFTVLMHMTDTDVKSTLAEMKRIVGQGHILLMEKTEPVDLGNSEGNGSDWISIGRQIPTWEEWMHPWRLLKTQVRPSVFEREAYANIHKEVNDAGTYMLFRND